MGLASSRTARRSMPGSLSIDPAESASIDEEHLDPHLLANDDGVAPKDVIDQEHSHATKLKHHTATDQVSNQVQSIPGSSAAAPVCSMRRVFPPRIASDRHADCGFRFLFRSMVNYVQDNRQVLSPSQAFRI